MSRQWRVQTWVGGSLMGAAGAMAALPAIFQLDPAIAFAALGPGIAGATNFLIGWGMKRGSKQGDSVLLSDEAASLLRALVVRAQVWQGGWRPRNAPLQGPHAWPGYRAPLPPSTDAMEALEQAAAAHNRVADALGDASDERAKRLRTAADAGMGEALHQAATGASLQETVERLTELANLVGRAAERPEAVSPLRSNLEATLEELRAEDEARQELRG